MIASSLVKNPKRMDIKEATNGVLTFIITKNIQYKTRCVKDTKINYSTRLITTYGHGKQSEGTNPSQSYLSN